MVVHTLHEVAHQLGVEERHGQLQELDEEVAYQRNVYAQRDVEQQPAADKIDGSSTNGKHQLPKEYQPYKADILVLNTHIHNGLCEERQNKLQQAADEQA